MQPMRILYAGTPAFAVPALQQLLGSNHHVPAVLTQPDRPAGRGRKLQASPVKQLAVEHGLTVLQPETLRDESIQLQLHELQPDLMVVTAYGLLLPQAVLDLPKHGCWNIHASLLPRWRGAAPIQRAIEAGDPVTGITIMQMDKGLDTGDMLLQTELPVGPEDTSASLHDKLSETGAEALLQCLHALTGGQPPLPQPQDHEHATYAHRLNKAEAEIDWQQPAEVLARQVRAFNPWPVSWTYLAGKRNRIWQVQAHNPAPAQSSQPHPAGHLFHEDGRLMAACGAGILEIMSLQPEGSRVMTARDWLNAHAGQLAGGERPAGNGPQTA